MMSDDQIAGAQPGGKRNWLKIGLLASLAINVLLLGLIGGSAWRLRDAAMTNAIGPSMFAYSNTLPGDRRAEIRRLFVERRPVVRPLRVAAQQARREVREAMVAEPFDKARLVAAHDRMIAAETRLRTAIGGVVADAAEKLNAEERRAFTRWRGGRRGGPGGMNPFDDDADAKDGKPRRP